MNLHQVEKFIILVLSANLCFGQVSDCSDPVCSGIACPGTYVSDNLDCHNYYVCLEGCVPSDQPVTCPEGQFFDQTSETCMLETVACSPNCKPPSCYEPQCSGSCSYQEYGDTNDCSKYHACMPDCTTSEFFCTDPDKLYYDSSTNMCVETSDGCCNNCFLYCPENLVVQVPHPTNCTSYYLCQSGGVPSENDLYHCPIQQVFNPDSGHCEDGDPDLCVPVCNETNFSEEFSQINKLLT